MRSFSLPRGVIALLFSAALMSPAAAAAQGHSSIEGFGGFGLTTLQSHRPSLGGAVTFDVTPNVQVIGEAGRLGNVLPTLSSNVFDLTRSGLRVSAFYVNGGARFLAAPSSRVTPYGEVTAGVARIDVNSTQFGALGNLATSLALGFVGRTSPMAGVGGGVLVRGGPVVFDLGYRYKQLFADDLLQAALGFGRPLGAPEVRAGIGVRF
jgi:hypothetical protein